MKINVGEWIIYDEGGYVIFNNYADDELVTFTRKKDAIDLVRGNVMDTRETPRVYRDGKGSYRYLPKDVDTGEYGETYLVERVTEENIEDFEEVVEEQLKDDAITWDEE